MIDIGANLAGKSFCDDLDEVLQRATEHGVQHIVVTGSDVESSERASQLQQRYPLLVSATAGTHPHVASSFDDATLDTLRELLGRTGTVAIGETGLDYNRNYSSECDQLRAFDAHLELAGEIDKPLFLHERDAHPAFFERMRQHAALCERAVVHCFTGNREALHNYLDLGLWIGITGWICDAKRGRRLRNLVRDIPMSRVMIETDAPYLIPARETVAPLLAKKHRNEPWTLKYVAAEVASSMGCDVEELIAASRDNAKRFFRLQDVA